MNSSTRRSERKTLTLHEAAYALRPVRITRGELREYEAITFPANPIAGCHLYLRRCGGELRDDGSHCLIDVLDASGDVVQDFPVTRRGFEYLRRALKFRRVDRGA